MSKYSHEEKMKAALKVVENKMFAKTCTKILETSHVFVQNWIAHYKPFISISDSCKVWYSKYSPRTFEFGKTIQINRLNQYRSSVHISEE